MDDLAAHLAAVHGVKVTGLTRLDADVWRVRGPDWVARVSDRPAGTIAAEAAILRGLQEAGFPAERLAGDPSRLDDGRHVVVTHFLPYAKAAPDGHTYAWLGGLLGRLHTRQAPHPGGEWHHLAAADATRALESVRGADPALVDALFDAVDEGEDGHDLPQALVHPDCVPSNGLRTPDDKVALVDWAGAGQGPRLLSLAVPLWAANHPRRVHAVFSRYQRHIELTGAELDRLAGAILTRPLLIACWELARRGRSRVLPGVAALDELRRTADRIAAQVRAES